MKIKKAIATLTLFTAVAGMAAAPATAFADTGYEAYNSNKYQVRYSGNYYTSQNAYRNYRLCFTDSGCIAVRPSDCENGGRICRPAGKLKNWWTVKPGNQANWGESAENQNGSGSADTNADSENGNGNSNSGSGNTTQGSAGQGSASQGNTNAGSSNGSQNNVNVGNTQTNTGANTGNSTSNAGAASGYTTQVASIVNQERAAQGLTALSYSSELSAVAQKKAEDMARNNYFSHTSPTYGSAFDMLADAGISYRSSGENIAKGQSSPSAVMDAWMNSSGHRANILSSSYSEIGVGYATSSNGTKYWVQIFKG